MRPQTYAHDHEWLEADFRPGVPNMLCSIASEDIKQIERTTRRGLAMTPAGGFRKARIGTTPIKGRLPPTRHAFRRDPKWVYRRHHYYTRVITSVMLKPSLK